MEYQWPTLYHLIISETVKFVHKPIFEDIPRAITDLFYISYQRSNLARSNRTPIMKIPTKCEYLNKSVFINLFSFTVNYQKNYGYVILKSLEKAKGRILPLRKGQYFKNNCVLSGKKCEGEAAQPILCPDNSENSTLN